MRCPLFFIAYPQTRAHRSFCARPVRWCRHDAPDAHDIIYKHITILMNKLVAARWFLKELEPVALEWLAAQFKGRAADYWQRIVGVARVTATTSVVPKACRSAYSIAACATCCLRIWLFATLSRHRVCD